MSATAGAAPGQQTPRSTAPGSAARARHGAPHARSTIVLALLAVCALAADLQAQLRLRVHVGGLTAPLAFVQDPADRALQFVVQQNGHIRSVRAGTLLTPDFLDVSASIVAGGEQGLLGL